MKTAILVNGVPASGKSSIAHAVARHRALPLMTLDTVKHPLFGHFGTGDREHNRLLGRASYEIIFASIGDWPGPATVVIDAWFGFQPLEVLDRHLVTAGITCVAELWCHAPGAVLAERYAARVDSRSAGHPGLDYVPELVALAERAKPTGRGPCFGIDTTQELRIDPVLAWLEQHIGLAGPLGSGPSP